MNAKMKTQLILFAGVALLIGGALAYTSAGKAPRGTPGSGTGTTSPSPTTAPSPFSLLPVNDLFAEATRLSASDAVRLEPALSHPVVLQGEGREVYLQTLVSTTRPATAARREPVHLALVIDCSGSMDGEKMSKTKAAARQVVEQLAEGDRFTLVAYESSARVAYPSTPVGPESRQRALNIIDNLQAVGSTNISGGMDLAARELTTGQDSDRFIRRIVLLSDGQANMGETRNEALFSRAAEQRNRGIGMSAIGVGLDYNNALMEGLSEHGGGRLRFLDNADEIATAFMQELRIAATLVAADVKIILHPADNVKIEEVYGLLYERSGRDVVVRIPDLASTTQVRVLARLSVDARAGQVPVVEAVATYVEVASDRPRVASRSPQLTAQGSQDQGEVTRQMDRQVLGYALNGKSIADARRAMDLYNAGKREEALAAIDRAQNTVQVANRDLNSKALSDSSNIMGNLRSLFSSNANALGGEPARAASVRVQRKAIANFGSNTMSAE